MHDEFDFEPRTVVDPLSRVSKNRLRIDVNSDDIAKGKRCSAIDCPIAIAIRRAVPNVEVIVGPTEANIGDLRLRLPREIQTWIKKYDAEKYVEPLSFLLTDGGAA
jgi:hypothetical protein